MRALVTGATSGIGLELARLLAADGHELYLVARRAELLEQVAAELGNATAIPADLAEPGVPERIRALSGPVDVLVNNAGFGDFGAFAESELDRQLSMIDLNVRTLTELTHRYLGAMLERRTGRIMNLASTAAFQPGPLMATYYATKAYVLSFSEALSEETRGSGVTVTAFCPGPTASGFQEAAHLKDSKLLAGRRLPNAAEVARVGYRAMLAGRAIVVPGLSNRLMAESVRFAPRSLVRRAVRLVQAPAS